MSAPLASTHGMFSRAGQTQGYGGLGHTLLQGLNMAVLRGMAPGSGPNALSDGLIALLTQLLGQKDSQAYGHDLQRLQNRTSPSQQQSQRRGSGEALLAALSGPQGGGGDMGGAPPSGGGMGSPMHSSPLGSNPGYGGGRR